MVCYMYDSFFRPGSSLIGQSLHNVNDDRDDGNSQIGTNLSVCDSDEYEGADEDLIKDYTYQGGIANDLHPIIVP